MGVLDRTETRGLSVLGVSNAIKDEDFSIPLTPESELSSDADVGIKIPITPNVRDDFSSDADRDKIFLQDYFPDVDKHLVYDPEKDVAGSNPFSFVTPKLPDGRIDYWKLMSPTTVRGPGWDRLTDEQLEERHQDRSHAHKVLLCCVLYQWVFVSDPCLCRASDRIHPYLKWVWAGLL